MPIHLVGGHGRTFLLDAVIDTGFSGFLTLPQALVDDLGLVYSSSRLFSLGNGDRVSFDLYEAVVDWEGRRRDVLILASGANPLAGMSLLKGCHVSVDVVDGGDVSVGPIADA